MRRPMFKKAVTLAIAAAVVAVALTACGVSQSDYDKAVSERDAAVDAAPHGACGDIFGSVQFY